MPDADQARLERGKILQVLQAHANRHREKGEDLSTYCAEALIQATSARFGFPMLMETLRARLYYLRDKGLVKFHEVKEGHQIIGLMWRITASGTDLIEGNVPPDPGIHLT